jgi:uncharacterized protein (DUF486 family)
MTTIVLLTLSNIFMTFAWYGHLKYRHAPLLKVIVISWMIAFAEYCFQVPANRITGVISFFVALRFKPYRFLGWAYFVAFTVFVVLKGKNYYLAPIYPVYLAAGCIVIDDAIDRFHQFWLKPAIVALSLAGGAVFALWRCRSCPLTNSSPI